MNEKRSRIEALPQRILEQARLKPKKLIEAAYIAAAVIATESGDSFDGCLKRVMQHLALDDHQAPDFLAREKPGSARRHRRRRVTEIVDALRQLIASGDPRFQPGQSIPAGSSLEKELDGSHASVARAINRLVDEGLFLPVRKGLIVNPEVTRNKTFEPGV